MDHREEMRKEAEQWQPTAVRIIQRFRYGILALALLGVLVLLLQNLGFPKEVNHGFGGVTVHTQSGEILTCEVRIKGETTEYPFAKGKFSGADELTVFVNGKRILSFNPRIDRETGSVYAVKGDVIFAMTPDRNRILLEMNLKEIFPEMDAQRCLLMSHGDDRAYALLNLRERIGIPEYLKDRFAWFTEE